MAAAKVTRLYEAADMALRHAVGLSSKREILGCYANLGRALTDITEIDLRMRCGGKAMPCRIRRSDIFVLAEIFHERQYRLDQPLDSVKVIVDAGANIGLASLWLLGRYEPTELHAFEPEPDNFRLLQHNLGHVQGTRLNRFALGSSVGQVTLSLAGHGAMHSTSQQTDSERSVRVPSVRLDSYMDEHDIRRIGLLKLDVEGAELDVLEGLGQRIADVDVIVGEVHERMVDAVSFYQYLRSSGFSDVSRRNFRGGAAEGVHGFTARRTAP